MKLFNLLIILFVVSTVKAQDNSLFIPDTLSGTTFNLKMQKGTHEFWPGITTNTNGFNGTFLGPTLIFKKGDFITLNVTNEINETSTVHWHGMHVAPKDDGGPHTAILANETWSPDFTVMDNATTFWYHPHLHEFTQKQVVEGLAGLIIVRDDVEANLSLPRTYGVDDIPLIIQDKSFTNTNQIDGRPLGDSVMVNGTLRGKLSVSANIIRFRLLNGSAERTYNIGLENDRTFQMIGSDGGLLEAPVVLTRKRLAPGERVELLLDLTNEASNSFYLKSYSSELPTTVFGGPSNPNGPGGNSPLNGVDFNILQINVGEASEGLTAIPETLVQIEKIDESSVNKTRTKVFNNPSGPGNPFTINGEIFDMMVMNDTVMLNDVEIWELKNSSNVAHPFHIHDIQFFILDRNGVTPNPEEQGRKDVVLVDANEIVRFITKFEDFTDEEVPYMFHCHILGHEDAGMMGQFIVVEQATSIENGQVPTQTRLLEAYPNPFNPTTTIRFDLAKSSVIRLDIISINGSVISQLSNSFMNAGRHELQFNAKDMASGMYLYRLTVNGEQLYGKLTLIK